MKQPDLLILDNPQDIESLQIYLADKDIITYDIETTGTSADSEIIGFSVCAEEDVAWYVILAAYNPETKLLDYYPENKKASYDLIKSLQGKSLVMHNAVFDCSLTESFFKICLIESLHTDTMVLAHLLNENRRIGLKELGTELFGDDAANEAKEMKESVAKNGGTLTKANYEMWKADSQLMAKYGAKDALLTYKVFMHLVEDLYTQGLEKFFYEDESMPLLKGSTYQLNTTGLKVDNQGLQSLKKQLEAECLEAKNFIYEEIKPYIQAKYPATTKKNIFNIGSSSQLSWLIFGEMGLEFNTLTKEGKNVCKHLIGKLPYSISAKAQFVRECLANVGFMYMVDGGKPKKIKEPWAYIACDKTTLKKLASKYKWIEKLTEYQRKTKILTTYVKGISDRTKYGVIHPSFLQTGTTSGRYSSRNPNFQNLPRDDKRIKQCIISRPGKVFVGADYSQLEPRVFSYLSQDKNLMAAFNGTSDFYSVIGMRVYGKTDCTPQKEGSPDAFGIKYKKLRDLSKVIALATVYGATANQLASTTGKNTEDTQEDIDTYLNEFEGVKKLMTDSHGMAKSQGYVENIFGRKRRMPEAKKIDKIYGKLQHKDLPYEARSLLNLSTNHRVQSTGASIVNRAAIKFNELCKEIGIKAVLVCQVHDSLIAECDEAEGETVSLLLQEAMENTTILEGVPLEAVPKIGKNLAEV